METLCFSAAIDVKRDGCATDSFNMSSLHSSLGFSLCSMPRKHRKISTSITNFSELDVNPICSLSSFKDESNFDSLDLSCMLKKDRRSSLTSFFSISYIDKFDQGSAFAGKLGLFGCEDVEAVGSMDFDNEERKLDDISDTSSNSKYNTFESGDDLEGLVVVQQEFVDFEFSKLNTAGLTGLKQENKVEEDYFTPVELEELGGFMEHMDRFETRSDIDEIDYEQLDFIPLKPSSSQQSGYSEDSSESVSIHVSKGKPISKVSDSIALNRPKRKGRGRPRKYLSDSSDSSPSTPTKSILGSTSSQKAGGPLSTKRSQRISDGQIRESLHDSYVDSVYNSSYASLSRQKRKYTCKNIKDEQLYSQSTFQQTTASNGTALQVNSSRHSAYPVSDSLRNKSTTQGGMNRGHTRHSEGSKLRKRKGYVGAYSPEARRILLQKYLEKRKKRVWTKKIKYEVRKSFADSRLRVKGRFIKKEDEDLLRENLMIAF